MLSGTAPVLPIVSLSGLGTAAGLGALVETAEDPLSAAAASFSSEDGSGGDCVDTDMFDLPHAMLHGQGEATAAAAAAAAAPLHGLDMLGMQHAALASAALAQQAASQQAALVRTNQRAQQALVAAPLAAAGMGEPQVVLAAPGPTLGSFTCTFAPTAAPTVPTPAVPPSMPTAAPGTRPTMIPADLSGSAPGGVTMVPVEPALPHLVPVPLPGTVPAAGLEAAPAAEPSSAEAVQAEQEQEQQEVEEEEEQEAPLPLLRRRRGQNYGTRGVSGSGNSWKVFLRLLPVVSVECSAWRFGAVAVDRCRAVQALYLAACHTVLCLLPIVPPVKVPAECPDGPATPPAPHL